MSGSSAKTTASRDRETLIKSYLVPFSKACERLREQKWFTNEWSYRVRLYPSPDNFTCASLSLMKNSWANEGDPWTQRSRIFFSFWTVEETFCSDQIRYNIHALKLRLLKNYKLESRRFAEKFRARLKPMQVKWPNVTVDYGPLTLMEGYINSPLEECEDAIVTQTKRLPALAKIIDELLNANRK
jgi:hypothetical protein